MSARSALVIAILLGFARAAAADSVDWNQYIEKPGTTYTPMAKQAPEAKSMPQKTAKKTVATKPKAKAPVKAHRKAR
jgi:hypothetical protein